MASSLPSSIPVKTTLKVVDMHTGGEPLRILETNVNFPDGLSILDKRRYFKEHHDYIRTSLMLEPRGHGGMYGAFLVPPSDPEAHMATLFTHQSGYSTMCGHGVIALGRYAVDFGHVTPKEPETEVKIECPCGLVTCHVQIDGGNTGSVKFRSVPSFIVHKDYSVSLLSLNPKPFIIDVAYGGAFYAIVQAAAILGRPLGECSLSDVTSAGSKLTDHLRGTVTLFHPDSPDLAFLYGCIVLDGDTEIVIFAEGQVDRSPCGSGVTALMATAYAKGEVTIGQKKVYTNGITGSKFTGTVIKSEGGNVIVEVSGRAHYVGVTDFIMEEGDQLRSGFSMK